MIESKIINGHPWSIGCATADPSKCGEDAELLSDLADEERRRVLEWIDENIYSRETPNNKHTSYV